MTVNDDSNPIVAKGTLYGTRVEKEGPRPGNVDFSYRPDGEGAVPVSGSLHYKIENIEPSGFLGRLLPASSFKALVIEEILATPKRTGVGNILMYRAALLGSPYLTGVPLARFPCRDSLGGPDRYGALATFRDRRRERR